jgi:hypothetical protein
MRPLERLWNTAGWLALAASLALASPGVTLRAAQAGEAGAGSECGQPGQAGGDAEAQAFLAQLRQEQAARGESDAQRGIVVLNNRGFNYGPPPGFQLDQLHAEAAQKR